MDNNQKEEQQMLNEERKKTTWEHAEARWATKAKKEGWQYLMFQRQRDRQQPERNGLQPLRQNLRSCLPKKKKKACLNPSRQNI